MQSVLMLLCRFSIKTRMLSFVVLVLLLFGLIGAAALLGGAKLRALNSEFMASSLQEKRLVVALRGALGDVRRHEKDMVIHYEDGVAVLKAREAWAAAIQRTRTSLQALMEGNPGQDNTVMRRALQALGDYEQASERVLQDIQNGAFETAGAADQMLSRAKESIVTVEGSVDEIITTLESKAEATKLKFDHAMRNTMIAFACALALMLALAVPLSLLNAASIVRPIHAAREVATAIASGDLTQPIEVSGRDETAQLLGGLKSMQESLRALVGQLHTSIRRINDSSTDIATGNQYLSHRTEQAASNLQQAASSMEQLAQAVKQSAGSASQANQLVMLASEVAKRGCAVVEQVTATMNDINASSNRISDIIGLIDAIAFQTNILALNAAVEATSAGERGRGFSVVASEVRNLAGRSAHAAQEIKALIATSVERVAAGSRLVTEAGQTMTEMSTSVCRVADIIGEIRAASAEQSGGISQVSEAVSQLDQMTQQNAALVEQSAAAAASLRDQAASLASIVQTFKLEHEPAQGSEPGSESGPEPGPESTLAA